MSEAEETEEQGGAHEASGPLDVAGRVASHQTERGDVAGVPTWPIPTPNPMGRSAAPPVGLSWTTVVERLGIDPRVLQHEGAIVLAGEYFAESGYFLSPPSLQARRVDVGDIALRHGYFIGSLTAGQFHLRMPAGGGGRSALHPVIPSPPRGALIGLFTDPGDAERAKRKIVQGALGSGVAIQRGPLGVELRVERADLPGRVATVICAHAGAVISIGGTPVAPVEEAHGAPATGPADRNMAVDAQRAGTGVTGETEGRVGAPDDFSRA